jgi:outer membrane protein
MHSVNLKQQGIAMKQFLPALVSAAFILAVHSASAQQPAATPPAAGNAAAAAAAAAAASNGARIGFVSTERVLRDSKPAQDALKKIEGEFSRRDKEMQDSAKRLDDAVKAFEKNAPTMAATARENEQRRLGDQERDFQRRQREFREDLDQARNRELASVVDRANKVIKDIAQREKYAIVLQEAVWADPSIDITEKVLKALSEGK